VSITKADKNGKDGSIPNLALVQGWKEISGFYKNGAVQG
jgi:hypothetical protein